MLALPPASRVGDTSEPFLRSTQWNGPHAISRARRADPAIHRSLPQQLAGLPFDAAQACGRLKARISPAVNPVKITAIINGRGIMSRERLVRLPDFSALISIDLQ